MNVKSTTSIPERSHAEASTPGQQLQSPNDPSPELDHQYSKMSRLPCPWRGHDSGHGSQLNERSKQQDLKISWG